MRIYAMSDIHGCLEAFRRRIEQLRGLGFFAPDCNDELVLLGDYVDRGPDSAGVVRDVMDLERACPGRVVALMGNHEDEFLRWLGVAEPDWDDDVLLDDELDGLLGRLSGLFGRAAGHAPIDRLAMWRMVDAGGATVRSFLGPEACEELQDAAALKDSHAAKVFDRACARIRAEFPDEVRWLRGLRLCHETKRQIFVHAGIDESCGDEWDVATPRDTMLCTRRTPRTSFYKDVIAGHTPTSTICGDAGFHGALWDGASHYYIDGTTVLSGAIPVLVCDCANGTYSELGEDGALRPIRRW